MAQRKRAKGAWQYGDPRTMNPWDRLHTAALELADCDSQDDAAYKSAREVLRQSAMRLKCSRCSRCRRRR